MQIYCVSVYLLIYLFQAVTNPERFAKRKTKKNLVKKELRKRKLKDKKLSRKVVKRRKLAKDSHL